VELLDRVAGSPLNRLIVFLMLVSFFLPPPFVGQTPPSGNWQVGHDSWTFKEGTPADVTCLAQTNDGFLWLGGPNGLFRFDGTRFEPFSSPFGDRLLSTHLYSLFAPPSGGLWVGYVLGGFSFLNNGRVTNYGGEIASSSGSVYGFAEDRDGVVWAAASSGLWRFDHSGWQHVGVDWNAPAGRVTQVGFDSEGILWALVGDFGSPYDLIYLLPGIRHFKTAGRKLPAQGFTLDADRAVMTSPAAPPISESGELSDKRPAAYPVLRRDLSLQFVDRNNSLWIMSADKPIVMRVPKEMLHGDVNNASPGSFETYDLLPFYPAALVDREGNIWFGDPIGLHRFFYSPFSRLEFPQQGPELPSPTLAPDDHGAVWVSFETTASGAALYHIESGKVGRRGPEGISGFAYRAPDKTFWFSGKRCLWHLAGGDFVRVDLPSEMADKFEFLQAIAGDSQGGIWVSFGRHGLYRLAAGVWTPYGGRDDLPKAGILIEFTDSLGRVWFGGVNNELAVLDGDRVRVFGPGDSLQVGAVKAIYGRGSEIWIGGEFGLEQFDQGRFHNIAAVNDQWLRGISGIAETANGDLWLNAISGILHIRKAEISEMLKDPAYRVKGEHFGRREGLPGIATQVRPLPTAIEGTDGRLWFTLHNGVVWLEPAGYSASTIAAPPITIQSVSADDKSYAPAPRLSLPAHTSSVQISYSAVSLSDPEAIRFRYKLRETDKDWHEAGTTGSVTYRDLPPGTYHFNVAASDTNGVWADKLATAEFTILPAFYQTLWFRSLCTILLLAMVAGLYRLRLRQLARQYSVRLDERVTERTRIARELHDTQLIGRLMRAAVKHAGAERGLLIVPRGDELQIEVEAIASGEDVTVHLRDGDRAASGLPESPLRHVMRTQETVILDDASAQNPFSADPYIVQRRTRSMLCLPLMNQGKLIGLFYFENNPAPRVFTPDRVTVLKVLASQAAISLENTRLSRDLEDREGKIRRLVDANILGIFTWNLEGAIVGANEAFLSMVRYGHEELVSRHMRWTDLMPAEWRERGRRALAELKSTGSIQPIENEFVRKDGSRVPVLIGAALFQEGGNEGVAFVLDLSEQKRAEAEIRALKDQLYRENLVLREEVDRASMFEEIVGSSKPLQSVLSRIAKVAPTESTVLITGETGTGKELIARAIHKTSQRSGGAFVSVNCAAIPRDLIASELFGHEKGAFTGAIQRRLGRFELADGGTIFLDEVGELSLDTQVSLLRVLQEREFDRVGGGHPIHVDVRVLAATNRDLGAAVTNGSFRQDLFYRLNVFPIEVPPLRERKDDIRLLVEYFVQRYAAKAGKNIQSIGKKTLEMLQSYDWPGNIRELQNVIERSVILNSGEVFSVDEMWLSQEISVEAVPVEASAPKGQGELRSEREIIEAALAESRGRVSGPSGAAARLGIPPSTLERRIAVLKIDKKQFKFR
jgi:PAS domain S-box-containing protein